MTTATHERPSLLRTNDAASALEAWHLKPEAEAFPYDAVVGEFRRVGKHFVADELLVLLDDVRRAGPSEADPRLARFLDTALDKFDRRYDNPSYLALEQLELPGSGERGRCPAHAAVQRDRLLALLVADMLRFELEAARGRSDLLPEMRPGMRTVEKRCRHGLRAIRPALERLGLQVEIDEADPIASAGRVCCAVYRSASADELRRMQLTSLTVSRVHDEHMFMRVLQSYETAFAFAAVQLAAAIALIGRGDADGAAAAIGAAELAMRESSPLFSLIGTMQPEAFLEFRQYTDGASAIQSRNYKRIESLCRRPDAERLDSPAFTSTPEVRASILAGQASVDEALTAAREAGGLADEACAELCAAMDGFQAAILKWRKTHLSIAMRMLGERRGTGHTAGVSYLAQGRSIPVFAGTCPAGHGR